jgi:hypothetical protein
MALGQAREAVALLEAWDQAASHPESRELLALARFAAGVDDPRRGLELSATEAEFLPPAEADIRASNPGPVRINGTKRPRIERPRGLILDVRPEIVVQLASAPLTLRLVRNDGEAVLWTHDVPAGEAGEVARFALPADVETLPAERRHGVELRSLDGELLFYTDFVVAPAGLRETCFRRVLELSKLLPDPALCNWALGNVYLKHHLYADAISAYEAVPEPRRAAPLVSALEFARRSLFASR